MKVTRWTLLCVLMLLMTTEVVMAQCPNGRCGMRQTQRIQSIEEGQSNSMQPYELQVIDAINEQRALHGMAPLKVDEEQCQQARTHSARMQQYGTLFHASGYRECIAMIAGQPQELVSLWMESPQHREIILSPGTFIAVGSVRSWHTFRIF